jgi:hypothetical protein
MRQQSAIETSSPTQNAPAVSSAAFANAARPVSMKPFVHTVTSAPRVLI